MDTAIHVLYKKKDKQIFEGHRGSFVQDFARLQF